MSLVLERIWQGEVIHVSASGYAVDGVGWGACVVRGHLEYLWVGLVFV